MPTAPAPYMLGPNYHDLNCLTAADGFELQTQIRNTLRLLRPQRAKGYTKRRFGASGDGGYVHLDDFEGVDTAISLGIDHNITWDRAIADRGLTIHQYDHTVDDPAPEDPRMVFNQLMIAPEERPGATTLAAIVDKLDKGGDRPNLFLKMDIESCEWGVLKATSLDTIARFAQITGEFHYFEALGELPWRQTFFRCLRKLSKFYAPIHVHANNYAAMPLIANVPVPCVLEITFANRALYEFEDSDELFPTKLDAPCDPAVPDHFLGAFRF